jgi:hypothetical protein
MKTFTASLLVLICCVSSSAQQSAGTGASSGQQKPVPAVQTSPAYRYRVAWRFEVTGVEGHGPWQTDKNAVASEVARMNKSWPPVFHWLETDFTRAPQIGPTFFDWSDAAYLGGSLADMGTSLGHEELHPLLRGSSGGLSVGKKLAITGGLYGLMKWFDWKYPERRRSTRIGKIVAAVGFTVIAVHNSRRH